MNQGMGYLTFNQLKKLFNLPQDALLKNMSVNNSNEVFEFVYYTNEKEKIVEHLGISCLARQTINI